jgi:hypothetical protein
MNATITSSEFHHHYARHPKRETQRSGLNDLESSRGAHSGVPNHLFRFASCVFGMTECIK